MMAVGIDALSFYTPGFYLALRDLAMARGVDPEKFSKGLGQESFSVLPPDEDSVTMAAAAVSYLRLPSFEDIDWLIFATESGVDESKASGLYVHRLLSMPSSVRVIEFKQACYAGVAGLNFALAYLQIHPASKILLVCSDVARYALHSKAEASQGAAAVAMLLSTQPNILTVHPQRGSYTQEEMDFWRPSYTTEAFVDGHYSCHLYLSFLGKAYQAYLSHGGLPVSSLKACCYHSPFAKLVAKAQNLLVKERGARQLWPVQDSVFWSRQIGNVYTASLFLSLHALLSHGPDLSEQNIGFYGYGSGATSEFFSGSAVLGYNRFLEKEFYQTLLMKRQPMTVKDYEDFHCRTLPQDGRCMTHPVLTKNAYRFCGMSGHKRIYAYVP